MGFSITRILLLTTIGIMLAVPAWADLTFGVVPEKTALVQTSRQGEKLADYLSSSLGEPVKVRIFNNERLLHQWMNRYREVDIAIISKTFFESKHRGELFRLIDYQPTLNSNLSPALMVARRGLSASRRQQLQDLLLVMDTDASATKLLESMHVGSFSAPGTRVTLNRPAVKPTASKPIKKNTKPVLLYAGNDVAPVTTAPEPTVADKQLSPALELSEVSARPPQPQQPAAKVTVQPAVAPEMAVIPSANNEPAAVNLGDDHESTRIKPATAPVVAVAAKKTSVQTSQPSQPGGTPDIYSRAAQHATARSMDGRMKGRHYLLAIVAVLLTGLLAKLFLLYQRRPRRRPVISTSNLRMHHDWSELHGGQEPQAELRTTVESRVASKPSGEKIDHTDNQTTPAEVLKAPAAATIEHMPPATTVSPGLPSGLLQLDGKLGPRQIPAMLQLISASSQSGSLQVSSSHNEKQIIFIKGRISAVNSRDLNNKNRSGFLMNKLGYLLIREGKITEEQRDQALIMCEGDSSLRMGEALIRMGALKTKGLMESLRYQAKMVLHSLIVFPEGVFEFTPGEIPVKASDNLDLSVDAFLKEAAAHQNEWRDIREMIPSLDTVLEFAPGGHDKVNTGRMTVHQKFVLSLIDGRQPIRDICIAATMLDYELYRFLYLMTKAQILRPTAAKPMAQITAGSGKKK